MNASNSTNVAFGNAVCKPWVRVSNPRLNCWEAALAVGSQTPFAVKLRTPGAQPTWGMLAITKLRAPAKYRVCMEDTCHDLGFRVVSNDLDAPLTRTSVKRTALGKHGRVAPPLEVIYRERYVLTKLRLTPAHRDGFE